MCAESNRATPERQREERDSAAGSTAVRSPAVPSSPKNLRSPRARLLVPLGAAALSLAAFSSASCAEDTIPDPPATTGGGSAGTGGSGTAGSGAAGKAGANGGGAGGGTTSGGAAGAGGGGNGGSGGSTGSGGAGGNAPDGSAGTGTGGATGGSAGAGTGGAAGTGTGGAGGTGTDAGGQSGSGGSSGAGGSGVPDAGTDAPRPRDPECDLNGRWLLAQRNLIALPLAQCQATHTWFYYEIRHDGEGFTVTKGLHCGYQSVKKSSQSANVSNPAMWPAMMEKESSSGRTGTFVKQADRCQLTLPIQYVIRGATVAHYRNPANPLPVMGSAAAGPGGMPPGWEDWDNDGNPGFSLEINSPLAKGTVFLCTRDSDAINNTAPLSSALFKVPMTFTTSQSPLGTAPGSNPLITSGGMPWDNPDSHFTYFKRLNDGEAVGTDAQICEQVRALKDSLPGDANDMPVSADCK
jgi:hypothetical protein